MNKSERILFWENVAQALQDKISLYPNSSCGFTIDGKYCQGLCTAMNLHLHGIRKYFTETYDDYFPEVHQLLPNRPAGLWFTTNRERLQFVNNLITHLKN